ncbi:hypothetical protein [Tsukamurella soli]|uniref:Chromosome partition protein Smc n=1 Tax=Tsukamurella soli TaxID=644556 RepID=A0ABP8JPZ7_9ACTN
MATTDLHPKSLVTRLLRGGWSASGTALVAVFVALVVGSGAYLAVALSNPTPVTDKSYSDLIAARRAVDQSRSMFGLLSTAATNATGGVGDMAKAVPQIFDAVDAARTGAQQALDGLDSAPSASAAASRVAGSTAGIDSALSQVQGLGQYGQTIQQAATQATQSLRSAHIPGLAKVEPQLSRIDTAAGSVASVAGQAGGLRTTLANMNAQLANTAASLDSSLASARDSARKLRDGLAKISATRAQATTATNDLVTGLGQLKAVLGSIDEQLATAQQQLPPVPKDPAAEEKALQKEAAKKNTHPLPIALGAAALAGLLTYGIGSLAGARSTRDLLRSFVPNPLKGLAADHTGAHAAPEDDQQTRTVDRLFIPAETGTTMVFDTDPALSVDEIRNAAQTKITKPARHRAGS